MIKLYNTQTKTREEIKGKSLKLYACGPTVYERAHLGNLRTYVNVDILRRSLEYLGHNVKHVMNITDIEDKIIKKSLEKKISYKEITKEFEGYFWEDLDKLNVIRPDVAPHATDDDVVAKMITIIEKLLSSGYAYKSDDGSVYFAVDKFKDYGKLSHLDKSGIKTGARVAQDEYDKESAQDFAIWKAAKEGEPTWDAPFGKGRPGWHIECSAMSMLHLGKTIDIHAGGVDLVFPHHENEVAQSEAYTGEKFVKHWFHGEHLLIDGKRMGKSENNFYSIDEMSKKFSVEPISLRVLCLMSHYRERLNFTEESIKGAENALHTLNDFVLRIKLSHEDGDTNKEVSNIISRAKKGFSEAISDDLSTPKAMAAIFTFIKEINKIDGITKKDSKNIIAFINDVDSVLALGLDAISVAPIPSSVQELAVKREDVRKSGDYAEADSLRIKIESLGYLLEDTPDGPIIKKLNE